jgi:hypothetical protein
VVKVIAAALRNRMASENEVESAIANASGAPRYNSPYSNEGVNEVPNNNTSETIKTLTHTHTHTHTHTNKQNLFTVYHVRAKIETSNFGVSSEASSPPP